MSSVIPKAWSQIVEQHEIYFAMLESVGLSRLKLPTKQFWAMYQRPPNHVHWRGLVFCTLLGSEGSGF